MMTRRKSKPTQAEVPDEESVSGYRRTEDEIPRRFGVTPERDNASSGEENIEGPTEERPEMPGRNQWVPAAKGKGRRGQADDEEEIFHEQPLQGAGDAAIIQTPPRMCLGVQAGMANGLGMLSNYQVATPLFNGKARWSTFMKQFQAIAQNARWSMEEKLHFLLVSLKDEVSEYAFDLRAESLANYDSLVHELDLRFHVSSTRDNFFYNRKIRPNENLREYAADLKRLILKAYPRGISADVREDMIMKQFFDGLHDEEARYHVKSLQHPRNLDHAVELVEQYHAYCGKRGMPSRARPLDRGDGVIPRTRGNPRPAPVNAVRGPYIGYKEDQQEEKLCSIQDKRTSGNNNGGLKNEMEKLAASVQQMGEKIVSSVDGMSNSFNKFMETHTKSFPSQKKPWTCYRCGEPGHLPRECAKYQSKAQPLPVGLGNETGSAR